MIRLGLSVYEGDTIEFTVGFLNGADEAFTPTKVTYTLQNRKGEPIANFVDIDVTPNSRVLISIKEPKPVNRTKLDAIRYVVVRAVWEGGVITQKFSYEVNAL